MILNKIFDISKNLIFFVLFFFLIRYEAVEFSGFKLSLIWKAPIILFLIIYHSKRISNKLLLISYLTALSLLFNFGFPNNSLSDFSEIVEILSIPLFYFYVIDRYKNKPKVLKKIIVLTVTFFIISSVPFIFNFLEPIVDLKKTTTLENLGGSGNKLSGIFFHPNIASKVYVVSTLVILFFFYKGVKTKTFWLVLILVGMFSIYQTYSRIAWFSFIVATGYLFYKDNKFNKFILRFIPISLIIILAINFSIIDNKSVYNKLVGYSISKGDASGDLNQISSNRLLLYSAVFKIYEKAKLSEKLLGYGKIGALQQMEKNTGLYLSAHNRYFEILLVGGSITLFLYFIYLFFIYKIIFGNKTNIREKSLLQTMFVLMIVYQIPSHGFPLWVNYIFALNLAYFKILKIEKRNKTYIHSR